MAKDPDPRVRFEAALWTLDEKRNDLEALAPSPLS